MKGIHREGVLRVQQKFTDLRCREVINVADGCRLGYVGDMLVEIASGCVTTLIVPGPCRFLGLFGRECDFYIPWACIKRIGEDIILVDVCLEQIRTPRLRKGLFF